MKRQSAQMDAVRQPIASRRDRLESLAHLIEGVRSSLTHPGEPWPSSHSTRHNLSDYTTRTWKRCVSVSVSRGWQSERPFPLGLCHQRTLAQHSHCSINVVDATGDASPVSVAYLPPIQIRGTAVRTEQPGTCSPARIAMHISERREVIAYAARFASWTWPRWSSQRRRWGGTKSCKVTNSRSTL